MRLWLQYRFLVSQFWRGLCGLFLYVSSFYATTIASTPHHEDRAKYKNSKSSDADGSVYRTHQHGSSPRTCDVGNRSAFGGYPPHETCVLTSSHPLIPSPITRAAIALLPPPHSPSSVYAGGAASVSTSLVMVPMRCSEAGIYPICVIAGGHSQHAKTLSMVHHEAVQHALTRA